MPWGKLNNAEERTASFWDPLTGEDYQPEDL